MPKQPSSATAGPKQTKRAGNGHLLRSIGNMASTTNEKAGRSSKQIKTLVEIVTWNETSVNDYNIQIKMMRDLKSAS